MEEKTIEEWKAIIAGSVEVSEEDLASAYKFYEQMCSSSVEVFEVEIKINE